MQLICKSVFVSTEGPAEPAECGYLVSERKSAGGAAEIPAALGRPRDCSYTPAQPDSPTTAGQG